MSLITPQRAANLRSFVYVGADHSILYNTCLSAWAQFLVDTVTPTWLAPNAITLLGLFAMLVATVVAYAYAPALGATSMPAWVALLLALCMFAYSTLDNMDGKQARKTKSSSALGLLFDHGCDAINAGLTWSSIAMVSGTQRGSWHLLCWFFIPTVPFFFNTWEEMVLGKFILPVINGPNEGIFLTISLLLLQFFQGQAFTWRSELPAWPALAPLEKFVWPLVRVGRWLDGSEARGGGDAALLSIDVILTLVLYGVVITVVANGVAVARHVAREGLPNFLSPALLFELPATFLLLMVGIVGWLFSEGTRELAQEHWVLTCGVATVLIVELNTRIMLAFTTRDEGVLSRALHMRTLAFAAVPLAVRAGAPTALGVGRDEFCAAALLAGGVAALLPCVNFVFAACTQVATALGIATFSLTKPAAAEASSSSSSSNSGESKRSSSQGRSSVARGKSPAKGNSSTSVARGKSPAKGGSTSSSSSSQKRKAK